VVREVRERTARHTGDLGLVVLDHLELELLLEQGELVLGAGLTHHVRVEVVELVAQTFVLALQLVVAADPVPGVAEGGADPSGGTAHGGGDVPGAVLRGGQDRDTAGVERDQGDGEQRQDQQDVTGPSSVLPRLGEWAHVGELGGQSRVEENSTPSSASNSSSA
jgi:hypothetical protein